MKIYTLTIEEDGECSTRAFLDESERDRALYQFVKKNWEGELDEEFPEDYEEYTKENSEYAISEFFHDRSEQHDFSYIKEEVKLETGSNHVYTLSADEIREMAEDEHGELTDEEVEKIISTLDSPKCSSMTDYVETVIDTCIAFARS